MIYNKTIQNLAFNINLFNRALKAIKEVYKNYL